MGWAKQRLAAEQKGNVNLHVCSHLNNAQIALYVYIHLNIHIILMLMFQYLELVQSQAEELGRKDPFPVFFPQCSCVLSDTTVDDSSLSLFQHLHLGAVGETLYISVSFLGTLEMNYSGGSYKSCHL